MVAAPAWIGWDVGGAHLKAAAVDAHGRVLATIQEPCPLWRGLEELDRSLDRSLAVLGAVPRHAVTMTGELVDAFTSRSEGVAAIADRMAARLAPRELQFYAGRRGFVAATAVASHAADIASANWLATAAWCAAGVGDGLLVDIGSTTTDLIALRGGAVAAQAFDDAGRLASGELVYAGVVRTPLFALAAEVPFEETWAPLIPEHFATAADVYRLTGELVERYDQHPAADGGAKTPAASARRIARALGRDLEDGRLLDAWIAVARYLREAQLTRIVRACVRVQASAALPAGAPIIAAGCGAHLVPDTARRLGRECLPFASRVDADALDPVSIAQCAPALAAALLASTCARS